MADQQQPEQQREEFRIVYPLPARPVASIGDREYTLLDVSEHALRLNLRRHLAPLQPGERVAGRVRLAQGVEHVFVGLVTRTDGKAAVVLLDETARIDLAVIFREQRFLRSQYPNWR